MITESAITGTLMKRAMLQGCDCPLHAASLCPTVDVVTDPNFPKLKVVAAMLWRGAMRKLD